ncbi:MAG: GNAT family N-acetyltransferase [Candidatus Woesearchaeota archaeon]
MIKQEKQLRNIKNIMKSFWKKDVAFEQLKKETILPVWFSYQEKNTIVGFINGYIIDYGYCKIAQIENIEVHQEFQGKGIGYTLMDSFIQSCKKQGVSTLSLRVECDNKHAISLYKKCGFTQDKKGVLMELTF